ncbi:MAG: AAA family ATPase [Rhodomicrobiaceae bacterium]
MNQAQKNRLAILIAGPSGVGKSTLCLELRQDIFAFSNQEIGYICADAYAHLSFPWRGNDFQLDVKYKGILASLKIIETIYEIILLEDTFRRQTDIDQVQSALRNQYVSLITVVLSAQLSTLIDRNKQRDWPHKVEDDKIVTIYERHQQFNWTNAVKINAEVSPHEVRASVFDLLRPALQIRPSGHLG